MKTSTIGSGKEKDPEKAFEQAVKDRLNTLSTRELLDAWEAGDIGLAQWSALPLIFRLAKATGLHVFILKSIARLLSDTNWTYEAISNALPGYGDWHDVASDTRTPAHALEALARDPRDYVRWAVARNPSTPENILSLLAEDEEPVRYWLASNPSASTQLLNLLSRDKEVKVRAAVSNNLTTPIAVREALLIKLAENKIGYVRQGIAASPLAPMQALETLAGCKDKSVLKALAKNPSTPVAVLDSLADQASAELSLDLISNPGISRYTKEILLKVLCRSKFVSVRQDLAKLPELPVFIFEALAKDPNDKVRMEVAASVQVNGTILQEMANDDSHRVRQFIGKNEVAPTELLNHLACDANSLVRSGVASNPKATHAILAILTKDHDSEVRCQVASNPSTKIELLLHLIKDSESTVRRSAAGNIAAGAILEELVDDPDIWVRKQVAMNVGSPADVLASLSKDKESAVRIALASNASTPAEVLEKLASDRVAEVVLAIILNPNTPLSALLPLTASKAISVREALTSHAHRSQEICRALWQDSNDAVRHALMQNPKLNQAMLDEMADSMKCERDAVAMLGHQKLGANRAQAIADKLLKSAATDSPWYRDQLTKASAAVSKAANAQEVLSYFGKDANAAALANRPLAPVMAMCSDHFVAPIRIIKLSGSTDWLVRAAVARNPCTPPKLVKELCADAHPLVAMLAQVALQKVEQSTTSNKTPLPEADMDFARAIKEILGRVSATGALKYFRELTKLFVDNVWCDHLSVGQISWMTAALIKSQHRLLPFKEFPGIHKLLEPEQAALMIESAVHFESTIESIEKNVSVWAAEEPACPLHILKTLANDADPDVALAAIMHPAYPPDEQESELQRLLKLKGWKLLKLLVNSAVPVNFLEVKASSRSGDVRKAVAENPSTPVRLLKALSKDSDVRVRRAVAKNPSCPVTVLSALAKNRDTLVRMWVAESPAAPVTILEILGKDESIFVRDWVAKNPSTPIKMREAVLTELAGASFVWIPASVAANAATPVAVLETLAADKDFYVRQAVAGNPSTPLPVLALLSRDSDSRVRRSVAANQGTSADLLQVLALDNEMAVRRTVAQNSSTPVTVLEAMIQDASNTVLEAIAINPSMALNVRISLLGRLLNGASESFRFSIADSSSTPQSTLASLAEDDNLVVRCMVTNNPSSPPDLRDRLISWWLSRLQRSIQREICVRKGLAPEPVSIVQPADLLMALNCLGIFTAVDDNSALTKASRSKDWLVRFGVALHPSAPVGILKILRNDIDPDVAKAAAYRATSMSVV